MEHMEHGPLSSTIYPPKTGNVPWRLVSVKYPVPKFGYTKTVHCRCFWTLVFSSFPSLPGVLQGQFAELAGSLGNQGELSFSKMFNRKETESLFFVGAIQDWLTYVSILV